jgi:hypothetical protein
MWKTMRAVVQGRQRWKIVEVHAVIERQLSGAAISYGASPIDNACSMSDIAENSGGTWRKTIRSTKHLVATFDAASLPALFVHHGDGPGHPQWPSIAIRRGW